MGQIEYLSFDDILGYYADTIEQSGDGTKGVLSQMVLIKSLISFRMIHIIPHLKIHLHILFSHFAQDTILKMAISVFLWS